jgi:hypothetical protein
MFPAGRASTRFMRALVCVAWVGGQAALILTGSRRADGAFAFRMFPESSTIDFTLRRDVVAQSGHGTEEVDVVDGKWLARDSSGVLHRFRWDDRVKDGNIFPWGRPIHASYGATAQLERLTRALADVSAHIDEDDDTVRLVAIVSVSHNGGPAERIRIEGPWRNDGAR